MEGNGRKKLMLFFREGSCSYDDDDDPCFVVAVVEMGLK
jgi:hypothetical protein